MPTALGRVGTIALAEVRRSGGAFDWRTRVVLAAMAIAAGAIGPWLSGHGGLDFDRGIYRVAVSEGSPLLPAVLDDAAFAVRVVSDPRVEVAAGRADVGISGDRVAAASSEKGEAALAALRQAAKDFSYRRLLAERDSAAAFPVRVELEFVRQDRPGPASADGGAPSIARDAAPPRSTDGTAAGGGGGEAAPDAALPPSSRSGFSLLPPERSIHTPETLAPPFPFRSLVLAYAFLVPMNFVVQVYAGSSIAERIGRTGEALLASPARPWEIIVGKALPYFVLMIAVSGAVAAWIGGGWLSVLAVAPLALAFLALEFVAAMFARSFRELTFLSVFASVLLTIYAFLPAVFTDVHPVALVSPVSLVVMDLRGASPTVGEILYATVPLTLVSVTLYVLGAALYREEDLFHQKRVGSKAVDALARQVRGVGSGFRLAFLLIPFVFVAELLLVTFLFAWPVRVGVIGALLVVALVEEAFKAAPSYAALRRGLVSPRRALAFGALAGLGFFAAEKGFLLASLAGLFDVPAGAAVFGVGGAPAAIPLWGVALLLLAPLALHVATASATALGARSGGRRFALAFAAAVGVHAAYNYAIVAIVGGGVGP